MVGNVLDEERLPEFQTKSQVVYETLRRWILYGRLAPGQTIDQEGLATTLQVSRMPLRQALLKLEADGLIAVRPHHSAVIVPLSASDIEEIYAARTALEGMLAEVGAAHCDDERLAHLEALLADMEQATAANDIDKFVELDRHFHRDLYAASGYERTLEILDRLRDNSDRYIRFYAVYQHGAEQSIREHHEIIAAVRAGDSAGVRAITERHILRGASTLQQLAADQGAAKHMQEDS